MKQSEHHDEGARRSLAPPCEGPPAGINPTARRGRAICGSLILILLTVGCDLPGRPDLADKPVPPNQVLNFAALYRRNCAGCHGAQGKLGPAPPLNDPLFRAIVPETELEKVIGKGRRGTPMPAFAKAHGGPLSAAQVQVLVQEIKGVPYRITTDEHGKITVEAARDGKGISPSWGVTVPPPSKAPGYLAGKSGNKQAGAKVFNRACADCHGHHGQGKQAPINDQAFLELISAQELRRLVITGRPDLGMPNFADAMGRADDFKALTGPEIDDLIAFIESWITP